MQNVTYRRRQNGATIVTAALVLFFLLGFMGFALDFSHLFILKTELQTAMDSCALAAAQELDGQSDALIRARRAGETAGNFNRVDLQSVDWRGKGQIADADITFKNDSYIDTSSPAAAKYAQCRHTQTGVQMWLMHAMAAFSGATATFPGTQNVLALAVATRSSAQTTCPMPVALRPKPGTTGPSYGFAPGEWVTMITQQSTIPGGEIGWVNLDGSNSASETEAEMNGYCGVAVNDPLGTPGVQASIVDAWNYRFGIYKTNADPATNFYQRPDFTGYAYTTTNWPSGQNAYAGPTPAGAPASAENFVTKRVEFASCADTGTSVRGANSCESISGLSLNSFQTLATPGANTGQHWLYGRNRRIATVPVIGDDNRIIDYACMLLLQPLSIPMTNTQLEFIGNASDPNSPCATSGLPGGSAGPLVPVLVQ